MTEWEVNALKLYDDIIARLLKNDHFLNEAIDYMNEAKNLPESMLSAMIDNANNAKGVEDHATVTAENVEAELKRGDFEKTLNDALLLPMRKHIHITARGIRDLLRKRAKEQVFDMPSKLYRGQVNKSDPEVEGFGINDSHNLGNHLVFVTTEPSVAASYARSNRFDREGVLPTNYGDWVYEIDTTGLDPEKFQFDDSAVLSELLFGPQYKYLDKIPQEDVTITDQAGNTRTIPRIRRQRFLSDGLVKDVYMPPMHLLNGLVRRF